MTPNDPNLTPDDSEKNSTTTTTSHDLPVAITWKLGDWLVGVCTISSRERLMVSASFCFFASNSYSASAMSSGTPELMVATAVSSTSPRVVPRTSLSILPVSLASEPTSPTGLPESLPEPLHRHQCHFCDKAFTFDHNVIQGHGVNVKVTCTHYGGSSLKRNTLAEFDGFFSRFCFQCHSRSWGHSRLWNQGKRHLHPVWLQRWLTAPRWLTGYGRGARGLPTDLFLVMGRENAARVKHFHVTPQIRPLSGGFRTHSPDPLNCLRGECSSVYEVKHSGSYLLVATGHIKLLCLASRRRRSMVEHFAVLLDPATAGWRQAGFHVPAGAKYSPRVYKLNSLFPKRRSTCGLALIAASSIHRRVLRAKRCVAAAEALCAFYTKTVDPGQLKPKDHFCSLVHTARGLRGRSPRKPADQRQRPARFLHARIRERPRRKSNHERLLPPRSVELYWSAFASTHRTATSERAAVADDQPDVAEELAVRTNDLLGKDRRPVCWRFLGRRRLQSPGDTRGAPTAPFPDSAAGWDRVSTPRNPNNPHTAVISSPNLQVKVPFPPSPPLPHHEAGQTSLSEDEAKLPSTRRLLLTSKQAAGFEGGRETGLPRETPPVNGTVRHVSPRAKIPATPPEIERNSPSWEALQRSIGKALREYAVPCWGAGQSTADLRPSPSLGRGCPSTSRRRRCVRPVPRGLPATPRSGQSRVVAIISANPRENPSTNGIVRHDSNMRESGANRPGIEPGSPWWGRAG
ncbi:hypothetical protein PR048_006829 [Dryococelus australis]|uniref:C2H2-type domain-containing protein n=1 Tax=Dryococelus australis TaxID=614101 RepID=A0ABQ9ICM7_9NEOP|nr:hypothetical protein PR048_006829 [Dryococelus australis]